MYILVIEDNPDIIENLYDYFEGRGHTVDAAYDGSSGLEFVVQNIYDVVILDLMLPGMDGLEVCEKLREQGRDLPVLMLTARDTVDDKVLGLGSGADDYLVKPYSLKELEARLQALVRRARGGVSKTQLFIAGLELDTMALKVKRAGQNISLPPITLKILELLMRQSPRVVSRLEIERYVWGNDLPGTDSLRVHINTLRNFIDKPFDKQLLKTVRGMGYCISDQDDAEI
ncbi:MAG: response regulator transcription factor [Gammaproteobacteria bacterium]|nr:response regulator transcription factor [Gammaproteobacteria bacterium]